MVQTTNLIHSRVFVSHPNKEILQLHSPEKFGCATVTGQRPRDDERQRDTAGIVSGCGPCSRKEHRSGCQQCARARSRYAGCGDVESRSRSLCTARLHGCCHRYEGFDRETDALAASAQIQQLDDQITANEKQRLADTKATESEKATEDEVDSFWSLKACSSLPAC